MSLASLKKIRVVVSLVILGVIATAFLDLHGVLPPVVVRGINASQLVPSLVQSLTTVTFWLGGTAAVLLLTFLFGRVYCSTLCPLGTLQDLVIRLAREVHRRRWHKFRQPMYLLHYGILAVTVLSIFMGSMFLLDLIEPFSNFGRILTSLVRPVIVGMNNLFASILGKAGLYAIVQVPLHAIGWGAVGGSMLFLAAVAYMAYTSGRLFCNTVCPAGALLGILSRFSIFKIVINRDQCLECGLCERVCKAGCINTKKLDLSYASCVGCFNCFASCPTDGFKFSTPWKSKLPAAATAKHKGRRRVIAASFAPLVLLLPGSVDSTLTKAEIKKSPRPITPPGARSEEHFTSSCTACHVCVSACPSQVLVPTFLEYGVRGLFQPSMEYQAGYCNYECTICGAVCPSGAILPLDLEAKKLTQVGQARFLKDECVVVKNKKDCGACSEHCPTKAVKMVPYEGKLVFPELDNDLCVGCGACEHACPTKPQKAIYVEANVVHRAAKKPEIKKLDSAPVEDFPF